MPFYPPEDGRETSRGQGLDVPMAKVGPPEDQRVFSGGLGRLVMRHRFPALETSRHVSVFCHTRTEENNQRIRRITISMADALVLCIAVCGGEGPFIPDGGSVPPCRLADSR